MITEAKKVYMKAYRSRPGAKVQKAEHDRRYRMKHSAECKVRAKKYREEHLERDAERAKKYAAVHRRHINEYWKNRRKSSPLAAQKHSELVRRYQQEHKVHLDLKRKEYERKHPEMRRAIKARRRLHESLDGGLATETVQKVYEANILFWGTLTCYLCESDIIFGDDQLEHKLPICRGGDNRFENLGIAHKICNCRKHQRTELEYRDYE